MRRFLQIAEVDGLPNARPNDSAARPGGLAITGGTFQWPKSDTAASKDKATCVTSGSVEPLISSTHSGGHSAAGTSDTPCTATLSAIDLSVQPGQLVVVCGPTGCGKSSLLSALLGEIKRLDGAVQLCGSVSYVPQRAQIYNQSLRDNILFGQAFEEERYHMVLEACALGPDLITLANGDLTEIGERGVNLSGGQQQRVNLARACYARSDVIMLDDVLSAVDAHVGQHIFTKCLCGFLRGRTRLLVTHATAVALPHADLVVAMGSGGRILAYGPPDDDREAIASLRAQGTTPLSTPGSTPAPTPPPPPRRAVPPTAAEAVGDGASNSATSGASNDGSNGASKPPEVATLSGRVAQLSSNTTFARARLRWCKQERCGIAPSPVPTQGVKPAAPH
jgi:ATP-binding cassette subfamily C (CFTR/MRP) protein 1